MARTYAVTLALTAMLVLFARGLRHGAGFEGTVAGSLAWVAAFGVVGAIVGTIAQHTVDESVRLQFEQEVAASGDEGPAA